MSSARIFQLTKEPVKRRMDEMDLCEDTVVLDRSDWVSKLDSEEDRVKSIKELKDSLSEIADIDVEKETLTFKPADVVSSVFSQWSDEVVEKIRLLSTGTQSMFNYRAKEAVEVFRTDDMFVIENGGCETSGHLLGEVADGYYQETYHIGGVLRYHM